MKDEMLVVVKRSPHRKAYRDIVSDTSVFSDIVGGEPTISFSHPLMVNRHGEQLLIVFNYEKERNRERLQNKLGFVGPIIICARGNDCFASLTAEDVEDVMRILEGGAS